jgi:hypothetical protein
VINVYRSAFFLSNPLGSDPGLEELSFKKMGIRIIYSYEFFFTLTNSFLSIFTS